MSIPIIAAGVGLAALVFAGSKEAKAPSADGGGASAGKPGGISVAPAQSSTSGPKGGATVPSHSDMGAAGGEVNSDRNADGSVNNGMIVAPATDPVGPSPPSGDLWAPTPGPSLDAKKVKNYVEPHTGTTGALGTIVGIGGMTAQGIGQSFAAWGESMGAIW